MESESDIDLVEPLEISAPLAHERARAACPRNMTGAGYGCYSYHGLWQYLRLFGIVKSLCTDSPFYVDACRQMARAERHRVLISGTADYGMLARVLFGFGLEHCTPDVRVVDLCETPLYLNRWYAARLNVSLSTSRANILHYDSEPVDLVCTHSFLHNFSPVDRPGLAAKWYQLLRPGGKVVLTNPLRKTSPELTSKFTPRKALEFRDGVFKAAKEYASAVDLDTEELAEMALDFATRRQRFNLRTVEEVRNLFENAGFRIDQLFELPVAGRDSRLAALGSPKTRVHLVASRVG